MNALDSASCSFVPGVKPANPLRFVFIRLNGYPIPEIVCKVVEESSKKTVESINISDFNGKLSKMEVKQLRGLSYDLNIYSYTHIMHMLLYLEEIETIMAAKRLKISKTSLNTDQEYLSLEVTGLSERRPRTIEGNRVTVKDIRDSNKPEYEGFVHAVKGDILLLKFHPQFHETYTGYDVSVEFYFNRTAYKRCHQAIDLAFWHLGRPVLFPTSNTYKPSQMNVEHMESSSWYNDKLNDCQKMAVNNILLGVCRPMPYCIYGPPGTGKTVTVVETIMQIYTLMPHSRILVATPSNSAANLITERLLQFGERISSSIIRLTSRSAVSSDKIPASIKPFCATVDITDERSKQSRKNDGININCQSYFIGRHRVTIGTCLCLGLLAQTKLSQNHYTHVIVDEAGQISEPEIMIPLTLVDEYNGQIILAGDPMQLGPVVLSKFANHYGLQKSFMSRLLTTLPYRNDRFTGFDNRLVTLLTENYRSLKSVLSLPSSMFYDNSLVPNVTCNEEWIAKMLHSIADLLPNNKKTGGIYMKGIIGVNYTSQDKPSWFNPDEALSVFMFTCDLYRRNISPDDIGIITPYVSQIKYLRQLFQEAGVKLPLLGTIEEFQGHEKPIILISTVRSSEFAVNTEVKHLLGFTNDPRRINVALTRAKIITYLFGNPHLLCQDYRWCTIIQHVFKTEGYSGCALPINLLVHRQP